MKNDPPKTQLPASCQSEPQERAVAPQITHETKHTLHVVHENRDWARIILAIGSMLSMLIYCLAQVV